MQRNFERGSYMDTTIYSSHLPHTFCHSMVKDVLCCVCADLLIIYIITISYLLLCIIMIFHLFAKIIYFETEHR